GKTTLEGRFYAETGSADLSCEDPSCWTWISADAGNYVRMRLLRNQPAAPQLQFYQDAAVEMIGADGADVSFNGASVQTGDQVDFFYTYSDAVPYGFASGLLPLTDDVWSHFGVKCDMGSFKIDTGVITYKKADVPGPDP